MTESASGWAAALDELRCRLEGHQALLHPTAALPGPGPTWTPPGDLGPLPHEHLGEALALVEALSTTARGLEQERNRVRRDLRLQRALPSRSPAVSTYLDVRS